MMTASAVLGSITMYCHVEVAFSKKVNTVGVWGSRLRCRLQGSAGGMLVAAARNEGHENGAENAEAVEAAKDLAKAEEAGLHVYVYARLRRERSGRNCVPAGMRT